MVEKKAWKMNGFIGIGLVFGLLAVAFLGVMNEQVVVTIISVLVAVVLLSGIVIVQPNESKVVLFFGKYLGTIREEGFFLTVPFSVRKHVSLRVRNFNSAKLKVNDIDGNPIEIAAVIVFKVVDTAKAMFDVDDYDDFVEIQSETALRHVGTKYPYDVYEENVISLRGNSSEVVEELIRELQERLQVAGVEVLEARLTHLAYSAEIASAMLQRQQAQAIVAARKQIVDGAVGMVQSAIEQLQKDGVIDLDEERKAQMVSNLLVAVVSDRGAQPVINAGSLY
ncbi:SPFH domain-containing protein [Massilibacterium senegalense]|uniref:SPFH domain-containing protein n=1 Tax=Massilibacterium senegalense TaxID=1632858 RepID=UPI0007809BFC|nr:SPFH domain-containing protein [Massilibacterium senegalense]